MWLHETGGEGGGRSTYRIELRRREGGGKGQTNNHKNKGKASHPYPPCLLSLGCRHAACLAGDLGTFHCFFFIPAYPPSALIRKDRANLAGLSWGVVAKRENG